VAAGPAGSSDRRFRFRANQATFASGSGKLTDRDCQPVDHRYNPEKRRTEVGIDGTWVPVDPAELVPVPSVDGSAHACFERRWARGKMTPVIRCVILPGEV
jgi:hypothetical protein